MGNILKVTVKTSGRIQAYSKKVDFQLFPGLIMKRPDCPPGRIGSVMLEGDDYHGVYDMVIDSSPETVMDLRKLGFNEYKF